MKGVHWIDLGQWPAHLAIVGDRRAYRRFMRSHCATGPAGWSAFPPDNGGHCQKLVDGSSVLYLISVGASSDQIETACTLAHEATHVMRWIFEEIGEDEPGKEAQAYLVEHIVRHGLKALTGSK